MLFAKFWCKKYLKITSIIIKNFSYIVYICAWGLSADQELSLFFMAALTEKHIRFLKFETEKPIIA